MAASLIRNAASSVANLALRPIANTFLASKKVFLPPGTVLRRDVIFEGKTVKALDRPLTAAEEKELFDEILSRNSKR